MSIDRELCKQKNELRKQIKELRLQISEAQKIEFENKIFKNIISLDIYNESDLILIYASTKTEIDTFWVITDALSRGKKVAVPRCSDQCSQMDFYYINSIDDLKIGFMGILEPDINAKKVTDFGESICIVPALCFDIKGHRLGYGKGFYDRFLCNYKGISIGFCFSSQLFDELPRNEFDVSVNIIITQDQTIHIDD